MNTYYCVRQKYFSDGTIIAAISGVESTTRPVNVEVKIPVGDDGCEEYLDYFNTRKEAKKFVCEAEYEA